MNMLKIQGYTNRELLGAYVDKLHKRNKNERRIVRCDIL